MLYVVPDFYVRKPHTALFSSDSGERLCYEKQTHVFSYQCAAVKVKYTLIAQKLSTFLAHALRHC